MATVKKIPCSAMGGPCDEEIVGETKEEIIGKGMAHLADKHPEQHAAVKAMTPDDLNKWSQNFDVTYEAAPSHDM
jgi:predicted small metal-binding protein